MGDALIRAATPADIPAIAAVYAPYVRDTVISFELEPPSEAEMARRMAGIAARYPYLVIEEDGVVQGYAYAGAFNDRAAYRWVTETTIYLAASAKGRGLGRRLYTALLDDLRARGFNAATGKISLPNPESVGLHEKLGFTLVGAHHKVGWKFDAWWDMGVFQLDLAPREMPPMEPRFGP
ncbi:GNAT family N-acetyltransferase [Sphingomonas crocodyli]|uniref:N-acetyltransferase family protein n=1 Tax=Sphingomonas crocodyli TaxID=1979270 RepID=A0A437MAD3_9SPHN|nr:GNAT family N-acetyltransferase [Sphingomonas crocodyli]RVT94523.1 N-acetyltransferase family protein [Sphingomonas crocodyli]